jgi:hypothetical protein
VTTRWTVTFDCAQPAKLAQFWALALGYVERPAPDGFPSWEEWLVQQGVPEQEWDDGAYLSDPEGKGPTLSFLKVPEPKLAKNRMHIDIQAGGGRDAVPWEERWPRVTAHVERLIAAGGTVLGEVPGEDGRPDHVTMVDPEGNEFCVV